MLVWYYFIIETNEGTYYLCESKENGELVRFPTKSYQVTVYDKDFYPKSGLPTLSRIRYSPTGSGAAQSAADLTA